MTMPLSWEAGDVRAPPPPAAAAAYGLGHHHHHRHDNTMDNAAFDGNGEVAVRAGNGRGPRGVATATVELGEFAPTTRAPPRSSVPQVVIVGGVMPVGAAPLPLCKPDLCRSMTSAQAAGKPTAMRPNPWHRHKTVLLVGTVVGLVVWALAYLLLQYYKVLE